MQTVLGDMVIHLRGERRAQVDVVDGTSPATPDPSRSLYHLAELDVWVLAETFVNITQLCRDMADMGQALMGIETNVAALAQEVNRVGKELRNVMADLESKGANSGKS